MTIEVPYGRSSLRAEVPSGFAVDILEAPEAPAASNALAPVQRAVAQPLGAFRWSDFSRARSVAIAINDKTRPVPHEQLLPPLLEKLAALGVPDSGITFFIAVGTHPPMTPDEFPGILPESICKRYRVVSHDGENEAELVHLGETSRGTPIWVNRRFAAADLRLVVGNIEPHQFVGFSGGVKTAAIGLAGVSTINRNHSLLTDPESRLGEYERNPARQDVEEIGARLGIHCALNAILSQQRQIVHVLAGDPRAVMQAGIPLSRQVCQVGVAAPYALLISSPGGHPKDINLYQAQKGLAHAALIAQPEATIILVAACPEGTGSRHYEEWMVGMKSHEDVIARFRSEGFRIGPHKAYQIARDASRARLLFCSGLEGKFARSLLLNPVASLQAAVDLALPALGRSERIAVLPHASSTIPYVTGAS